jgi:hypothetical protein
MQEYLDLRIDERKASAYLPEDIGEKIGYLVRKVVLKTSDPWVQRIGNIDKEKRKAGKCFFTGWSIKRKYTKTELNNANLFALVIKQWFEPEGEECGTKYDDTKGCPHCLAGAVRITPLRLNGRSLPKKGEIAKTIADELIVSRRFVELFKSERLVGAEFEPVQLSDKKNADSTEWFVPKIVATKPVIVPPTRFGEDPFDDIEYGKCPLGDTLGLNRLSEAWVDQSTYDGADLAETQQYVGHREGVLRPAPILLISSRLWRLLEEHGLKKYDVEVCHVV